jgi:hypothetical protein
MERQQLIDGELVQGLGVEGGSCVTNAARVQRSGARVESRLEGVDRVESGVTREYVEGRIARAGADRLVGLVSVGAVSPHESNDAEAPASPQDPIDICPSMVA